VVYHIVSGVPDELQWGHVFSDVETYLFAGIKKTPDNASMGPRLFRRGNKIRRLIGLGMMLLQWGHVFSDVETCQA